MRPGDLDRRTFLALPLLTAGCATKTGALAKATSDRGADTTRWSEADAATWMDSAGWLLGANFVPSTAINQLEMWQADTFDTETIDRELGWAAALGMNSMRVFLHDLLWQQDAEGFLERIDRFLTIADTHGIGAMLVLFDSVWDPRPQLGQQRAPTPHVHNPGWLQSPGAAILGDRARHAGLKAYVQGVISAFRTDSRVHVWDLFNEPDNTNTSSYAQHEPPNKVERAHELLRDTFDWARAVGPQQPLTAGVWNIKSAMTVGDWLPIHRTMVDRSDIVSFHTYGDIAHVQQLVGKLRAFKRPLICTEYLARSRGCTFDPVLRFFKEERVAAYNWGLVSGKTQTIYPWETWTEAYTAEPDIWHHDIFRADGTPFDPGEVDFIRGVVGR